MCVQSMEFIYVFFTSNINTTFHYTDHNGIQQRATYNYPTAANLNRQKNSVQGNCFYCENLTVWIGRNYFV